MLRVLGALLLSVVALCAVLVVRTMRLPAPPPPPTVTVPQAAVDSAALGRFAEAVRIPTVTQFNAPANIPEFLKMHALLRRSFPLVHARMQREVIDSGTLLFTWRGSDTTLAPVLLMGHQDVVPVEPGTEKDWTHPAFSGVIADGQVWGRGTLDDKINVMGLLEASESLLEAGFAPRRTIIFEFGHNEEGGGNAAGIVARLLEQRGIRPWFVLDEGGAVGIGMIPGVEGPVGVIGVAEKGYLSLRLTARGEGGHSSLPPRETAVSILGDAVSEVQESTFPLRLNPATRAMLDAIAPSMSFAPKLVMANLWLTAPLVTRMMSRSGVGNAMARTTTAATMLSGGIKDNVVPQTASAVVNFRLLPGDSVAWVIARVKEIVDDERVTVEEAFAGREASNVSPAGGDAWELIATTIRESFGTGVVAPYLLMGGTDSRNFETVSANVYRFTPMLMRPESMGLMHSTNERVSVDNYFTAIRFYRKLIETTAR